MFIKIPVNANSRHFYGFVAYHKTRQFFYEPWTWNIEYRYRSKIDVFIYLRGCTQSIIDTLQRSWNRTNKIDHGGDYSYFNVSLPRDMDICIFIVRCKRNMERIYSSFSFHSSFKSIRIAFHDSRILDFYLT